MIKGALEDVLRFSFQLNFILSKFTDNLQLKKEKSCHKVEKHV